ncbi:MAG: hypothetical protein ACREFV_10145 [Acetobacteraceae bacterium]
MSGYLHRLVHTVLHPRETVHPRTRPLFAPYRREPGSPSQLFEQAETAATPPARSESSAIGEPAETARQPARSDDLQAPLLPRTANEPPQIFESMQRADVSPIAGNEGRHKTLDEHTVEVRQRLEASQAQRSVPDSRRDAGVQSYLPLIQPQRSEANNTTPDTPQFSTKASRLREASAHLPAERRPARAEQEPDEIQIHIGRIEVTAVQPPAPRAPKGSDKNISLDAYLERRNGRVR